eukprot:jgi/Mesvir1/12843/Mv05875-RA.1
MGNAVPCGAHHSCDVSLPLSGGNAKKVHADRAAAAVLLALAHDAYALQFHLVYDLKLIRRPVPPQLDDPSSRFHKGKRQGDLTHVGDVIMLLLQSLASTCNPGLGRPRLSSCDEGPFAQGVAASLATASLADAGNPEDLSGHGLLCAVEAQSATPLIRIPASPSALGTGGIHVSMIPEPVIPHAGREAREREARGYNPLSTTPHSGYSSGFPSPAQTMGRRVYPRLDLDDYERRFEALMGGPRGYNGWLTKANKSALERLGCSRRASSDDQPHLAHATSLGSGSASGSEPASSPPLSPLVSPGSARRNFYPSSPRDDSEHGPDDSEGITRALPLLLLRYASVDFGDGDEGSGAPRTPHYALPLPAPDPGYAAAAEGGNNFACGGGAGPGEKRDSLALTGGSGEGDAGDRPGGLDGSLNSSSAPHHSPSRVGSRSSSRGRDVREGGGESEREASTLAREGRRDSNLSGRGDGSAHGLRRYSGEDEEDPARQGDAEARLVADTKRVVSVAYTHPLVLAAASFFMVVTRRIIYDHKGLPANLTPGGRGGGQEGGVDLEVSRSGGKVSSASSAATPGGNQGGATFSETPERPHAQPPSRPSPLQYIRRALEEPLFAEQHRLVSAVQTGIRCLDSLSESGNEPPQPMAQVIKRLGIACSAASGIPIAILLIGLWERGEGGIHGLADVLEANVGAGGDSAGRGVMVSMVLGAYLGTHALPDYMKEVNCYEEAQKCISDIQSSQP